MHQNTNWSEYAENLTSGLSGIYASNTEELIDNNHKQNTLSATKYK